jgi:hypothetical protein
MWLAERATVIAQKAHAWESGQTMSAQHGPPDRLASEDVIISAPMSYVGSSQRIMRIRRRAPEGWELMAITALAISLVLVAWAVITVWYLLWGFLLVPYRLLRRGARKRKVEAMRHRELMGTIQGSAAASAGSIVAATTASDGPEAPDASRIKRIGDVDRDRGIDELRLHLLDGRLTHDEFEERVSSAHRAKTRADLEAIFVDLPVSQPLASDERSSLDR